MRIWIIAAISLALFTAACGETKTQRATTGAAGGAILGAVLGGPIGALVGAGLGGAGGAYRDELRRSEQEIAVATGGATGAAIEPVDRMQAASAQRKSDLTNREVRDAQIALKEMGLYMGEIDGLYGRLTIAAVKEFQASRNDLPYTGTLDARTLQEIRTVAAKSGPANEGTTRPTDTTQSPDTREAAVAGPSGQIETGHSEVPAD